MAMNVYTSYNVCHFPYSITQQLIFSIINPIYSIYLIFLLSWHYS